MFFKAPWQAPVTFSCYTVFNNYIMTNIKEEEEEKEEIIMVWDTEENRLMISYQISIRTF